MYNTPMLTILPRIFAIIYIAFLSILALDIFDIGFFSWQEKLIAFIMHLIPSFLTIACLIIAWKRLAAGGILFLALAVGFTIWFRTYRSLGTFAVASLPPIIIGGLFIVSGRLNPGS